jgi:hypothetical protein
MISKEIESFLVSERLRGRKIEKLNDNTYKIYSDCRCLGFFNNYILIQNDLFLFDVNNLPIIEILKVLYKAKYNIDINCEKTIYNRNVYTITIQANSENIVEVFQNLEVDLNDAERIKELEMQKRKVRRL